jgi:hypothetical protein
MACANWSRAVTACLKCGLVRRKVEAGVDLVRLERSDDFRLESGDTMGTLGGATVTGVRIGTLGSGRATTGSGVGMNVGANGGGATAR